MAFPFGWLLLGSFMLILGAIIIFLWKRSERSYKQVANAPELKIADLKPGFAVLKGVVNPKGEPLIAPHSHARCVYYKYTVEIRNRQNYSEGVQSPRWMMQERDEQKQNFFIDDGTGTVEVTPTGANIDLRRTGDQQNGPTINAVSILSVPFSSLFRSYYTPPVFKEQTRRIEQRIAIGDDVCVIGTVTEHPPSPEQGRRFIVSKGKQASFFCISDKPKEALVSRLKSNSRLLLALSALSLLLGCFAFVLAAISMF